jgi:hypothetical protein
VLNVSYASAKRQTRAARDGRGVPSTDRGRVKVAIALGAAVLVAASLVAVMSPPAARASSWSGHYQGVAFGWTNDHAWAIASYSTVLTLGSGKVASLACSPLGGGFNYVCDSIVASVVRQMTAGSSRLTNHGIWIAIYPHWRWVGYTPVPYITWSDGRY